MNCKCGNQACAVRELRGLQPFCLIEAKPSAPAKKPCAACIETSKGLFGAKHGLIRCVHKAVQS